MYSRIKDILKDVRLLVAEDDDALCASLKDALSGYVSEIFICKDGKEALECFKENDINLVLSDINMPKLGGLKMASLIRQDDENVPILFMTAFDSDENMLGAIDLRSFGVLKKPFDKRELIMTMSFAANKFRSDFASVDLRNGFSFNAFSKELRKDGILIPLTKKEQNLLHLFLKNRSRVVSFEMIENYVWNGESCGAEAIRSFVYKLRKKLYAELIQNAQGTGYQLCLKDEGCRTMNEVSYV